MGRASSFEGAASAPLFVSQCLARVAVATAIILPQSRSTSAGGSPVASRASRPYTAATYTLMRNAMTARDAQHCRPSAIMGHLRGAEDPRV